jgi:two-component sensor histidine kinase
MHLTPMRFTTIEGTEVTVKVNSPKEARSAIKELRHRKKEVGLHRRALLRLQKRALKERQRLERAAQARARRRGFLSAVTSLFRRNRPIHDADAIEHELHLVDETLHNLDVCIVQIEGKLLLHG